MKKLLLGIFAFAMLGAFALSSYKHSNASLRDKVVQIQRPTGGSCSGSYIQASNGKTYILSAAHCSVLEANGKFKIVDDKDATVHFETIVKLDPEHDLMLLTAPRHDALPIAPSVHIHDFIKSITHGGGHAAHYEEGELLESDIVVIAMDMFTVKTFSLVFTNMRIAPGSSGGAVVNSWNELIGVVSAGDGVFGALVPLTIIQDFLPKI